MGDRVVGNYVKINRQMLEWRFWYSETAVKIWILLLLEANWKDGWFMGKPIPRGSLATSIDNLAIKCGKSRSTVKRWLKVFEEDGQITTKATNRFTVITILKYGLYQDVPENVNHQMNHQMDQQVNHQMNHQMDYQVDHNRRKKEGKKERKEEERAMIRESSQPTADEVNEYAKAEGLSLNAADFVDYYSIREWKIQGEPIRDWRALVRRWSRKEEEFKQQKSGSRGKRKDVLPEYYNPDPERKPESNERMTGSELDDLKALLASTRK